MQVTAREVLLHFRTNPISTLVALLLLLLFGLTLRLIYHVDIDMSRRILVRDEVQHLQLKEAYLTRQLQYSIAELRQFVGRAELLASTAVEPSLPQQLCQIDASFVQVQWQPSGPGVSQQQRCNGASHGAVKETSHEAFNGQDEPGTGMPSVVPGVVLELLGQQSPLERQQVRVLLPVLDAAGGVRARVRVDLSLVGLLESPMSDRYPDHYHGQGQGQGQDQDQDQVQTLLLDAQYPWRDEQATLDIVRGADRLARIKVSDSAQYQNRFGLYIVHPVLLTELAHADVIARWRLLSWVPPQVFAQHWRTFWLHAGYVLLAFMVLTFAIFFYSQRIIRKQADMLADLHDQRVFLDSLLNSSSDGMLTLGMDGDIQSCNTRTETLFGYCPGTLTGRPVERLLPSAYQAADQDYRQIYQQLLASAQDYRRQELVGVRTGGDTVPVEVSYCLLRIAGDDRLLLIVREITERKVAEQELDHLRRQYFQQEKMSQIGLLMAGILHEVGNPIAAIQGLLEEVLGDGESEQRTLLSDAHRSNLELVMQQANRIRGISQDVAGFASPHQNERGWLSINALLEGTAKLLSYDKRLQGIDLVLDLDPQLPAFEGVADQLTQVFMNLLVNAADALAGCAGSHPRLLIETRKLTSGLLRVVIRDNGCGIAEDAMLHIFDSFYTTKPKGEGTGLGLSICEQLIEEHGGLLELESAPGAGTEVRIFFNYESLSGDGSQRLEGSDALS
ncbi:MAG: ATP-binding protein [Motiliproteus sp.]